MEEKLPKRKNIRLKEYDYNGAGLYFLTICTNKRRKILSNIVGVGVPDDPCVELTIYGRIVDKYINQLNNHYERRWNWFGNYSFYCVPCSEIDRNY